MQSQLFLLMMFGIGLTSLKSQEAGKASCLSGSPDDCVQIELFAENPQIVTATGIDVDVCGRVWALEINTHFPSEGYRRAITLMVSLVPEKLSVKLTRQEMRDLTAYLQTLKSK